MSRAKRFSGCPGDPWWAIWASLGNLWHGKDGDESDAEIPLPVDGGTTEGGVFPDDPPATCDDWPVIDEIGGCDPR